MPGTSYQKGCQAEELAEKYLISKGYIILNKNWRFGKKELDIIGLHHHHLVIIEVKSRNYSIYPRPEDVVHIRKQRNIILATEAYIRFKNLHLPTRFDIISVVFKGREYEIEHIENAFFPEAE